MCKSILRGLYTTYIPVFHLNVDHTEKEQHEEGNSFTRGGEIKWLIFGAVGVAITLAVALCITAHVQQR